MDTISSRGHWLITIRPDDFNPERQRFADLLPTLERCTVRIRGWDFPHLEHGRAVTRGRDWIGGTTCWQYFREEWRFYQSGQFAYLIGIHEDWMDEVADKRWGPPAGALAEGPLLGIGDSIYRYTEAFEFAARLAGTPAGAERMMLSIQLRNLGGRRLWMEERRRALRVGPFRTDAPELTWERTYARADLLTDAAKLAREAVIDLFERFGLTLSDAVVGEMQQPSPFAGR